jgi:hypothetical protein
MTALQGWALALVAVWFLLVVVWFRRSAAVLVGGMLAIGAFTIAFARFATGRSRYARADGPVE